MDRFISLIRNLELPPHVLRQLGLSPRWQKKVPIKTIARVVDLAMKYRSLLKQLSSN